MPLQIAFDSVGDVLIVRCSGRIVAGVEVDNLQAELTERTKMNKRLVFNMREVVFLDSSGIGTLVRFAGSTKSAHGGLKFCELSEITARVLKLTRLDKVLDIYASEADALAAFAQQAKSGGANRDGVKILCVDSSLNVLAYLRELLAQHGFSVMTTSSAYDARNMLKAVRPSLIVLGPNVPGADQDSFQAALKGTPVLNLGNEFHAGEAAAEAESLMKRIQEAMGPNFKTASN
jgi:anti-anti-sigma factor